MVDNFEVIKAATERKQPLSSVTTCVIGITTLYFDDGTMWRSGLYFRPDMNTPGKYDAISHKEFDAYGSEASR